MQVLNRAQRRASARKLPKGLRVAVLRSKMPMLDTLPVDAARQGWKHGDVVRIDGMRWADGAVVSCAKGQETPFCVNVVP